MNRSVISLAALTAVIFAASAQAAAPMIADLAIDMTQTTVAAKLPNTRATKVNALSGTIPLPRYSGNLTSLPNSEALWVENYSLKAKAGTIAANQDTLTIFYAPEHGQEKAVVIQRENFFGEGNRPNVADRVSQLEEFYGKPSARRTDGLGTLTLYWSWDKAGALRPSMDTQKASYCSNDFMRTQVTYSPRFYREAGNLLDVCGSTSLRVTISPSIDKAFARSTYMQLVGHEAMFAAQDRINAQVAAFIGKARTQETAISKSAKPDF